jgi:predicted nucleic acid-binding protein
MTVFVDTSALYALLASQDPRHQQADNLMKRLRGERRHLMSSSYVLLETAAIAQRRLGTEAVRTLHEDFEPLLDVAWVDRQLHDAAMTALLAADRRGVSLVDWTSFTVMRRQHVDTAFAFDGDFERQGFSLLN